jgi:hypothetical protein
MKTISRNRALAFNEYPNAAHDPPDHAPHFISHAASRDYFLMLVKRIASLLV